MTDGVVNYLSADMKSRNNHIIAVGPDKCIILFLRHMLFLDLSRAEPQEQLGGSLRRHTPPHRIPHHVAEHALDPWMNMMVMTQLFSLATGEMARDGSCRGSGRLPGCTCRTRGRPRDTRVKIAPSVTGLAIEQPAMSTDWMSQKEFEVGLTVPCSRMGAL